MYIDSPEAAWRLTEPRPAINKTDKRRVVVDSDPCAAAHDTWWAAQRRLVEMVDAAEIPESTVDRAEGYRWAVRLANLAFDWVVEKNDPLHPVLFHQQDEYRKFIVDNPDVDYWFCVLDPGQTYRLFGNRGEAPYVGLTFGGDIFHWGQEGTAGGTLGQYHLDQFEFDASGDFELVLGGPERERNWIPLPDDTQHLAIRETFYDKSAQRGVQLSIERLGNPVPPPQLSPGEYAEKLELAASFMLFAAEVSIGMYAGSHANMNGFSGGAGADHVESGDDEVASHCNTEMVYMGGHWKLQPGEALEVIVHPSRHGEPLYWGLTLVNPWCESYDYRFAHPCTNNHQAKREDDGSWRLVIAPQDPGLPVGNWLDTGGRLEGYMLLRWVLTPLPPAPQCRVITLEELER